MCIGPQYRVNRVLTDLRKQKAEATKSRNRARSEDKKAGYTGAIVALDYAIALIREAADKKVA